MATAPQFKRNTITAWNPLISDARSLRRTPPGRAYSYKPLQPRPDVTSAALPQLISGTIGSIAVCGEACCSPFNNTTKYNRGEPRASGALHTYFPCAVASQRNVVWTFHLLPSWAGRGGQEWRIITTYAPTRKRFSAFPDKKKLARHELQYQVTENPPLHKQRNTKQAHKTHTTQAQYILVCATDKAFRRKKYSVTICLHALIE